MLVSIVIRTLNEGKYLGKLLKQISKQRKDNFNIEVVIVDSGSTDDTLKIANSYNSRVTFIDKQNFTFGRSLNIGSAYANGEILVYVSGHCIPTDENWIIKLIDPIRKKTSGYTYGGQLGVDLTKYSEKQIFKKYFPNERKDPQEGFFCNNANSAIKESVWRKLKFDETLTGLEDMELAKRYTHLNGKISYISDASVFHIHDESYSQIKRRFEREALALRHIMPEVNVGLIDVLKYIFSSIFLDFKEALYEKVFLREILSIVKYRSSQYLGTYIGNRIQRKISKKKKDSYFYPSNKS
jgi:glycosyltransferase involved in cell wall biosynthesis